MPWGGLAIARASVDRHEGASRDRIEISHALTAERGERETVEKALAEAQTAIRDLQTRLRHAVLERDAAREMVSHLEAYIFY